MKFTIFDSKTISKLHAFRLNINILFSSSSTPYCNRAVMVGVCTHYVSQYMYGSHIGHATMHGIFLLLLVIFFIRTVAAQLTNKDAIQKAELHTLRLLYLIMQGLGILWLTDDLFRFTIDPHTHILRDSILCKLLPLAVLYIIPWFYTLYLVQLEVRLETAFKGSTLALSRKTTYILRTFILILPLSVTVTLLIDNGLDSACIASWNPSDLAEDITFCTVPASSLLVFRTYLYEILLGEVLALNAGFAILFWVKFKKLIRGSVQHREAFLRMIMKHCWLTAIGSLRYEIVLIFSRDLL